MGATAEVGSCRPGGQLPTSCVRVATSGQGGRLAKCCGQSRQTEGNTSILERTGMQNLGWGKRMPQGPCISLNESHFLGND